LWACRASDWHSNGYTLARSIVAESKHNYNDPMPGSDKTIGEELLTPTRIYFEILELVKKCDVHGLAHITGSGLLKLHRITSFGFEITDSVSSPSPYSNYCRSLEASRTPRCTGRLNMGMGFVVVVPEADAKLACRIMGPGSKVIGSIVKEGLKAGSLKLD